MGNCLVTKLKGSVQNDNLPVYNTITLDYKNPINKSTSIMLRAPQGKTITVKAKVPFHVGHGSYASVSEFTFNDGGIYAVIYVAGELGEEQITSLLSIEGFYDLDIFAIVQNCDMFNLNTDIKTNLESLLLQDMQCINWYAEDIPDSIPSTVKYLYIDIAGTGQIEKNIPYNVDILSSARYGDKQTYNINALKDNVYIECINARLSGNITSLPKNTKCIGIGTSALSGSIEDLVNRMRELGRTSGSIGFLNFNWQFTYNNSTVGSQRTETIPVVDGYLYLTWDANSITWASAKPAELNNYVPIKSVFQYFTT